MTCRLPEGIAYGALYEAVRARGIIVYGCKGVLAERYLQIANMGHLNEGVIDQFLGVLAEELARLRAPRVPQPAAQARAPRGPRASSTSTPQVG